MSNNHQLAFFDFLADVRQRYKSWRYWVFVYDSAFIPAVSEMKARHFSNWNDDELRIVSLYWQGCVLGVAILEKRRMLAKDLRSIIRAHTGHDMTEQELTSQDSMVFTTAESRNVAVDLASLLLPATATRATGTAQF